MKSRVFFLHLHETRRCRGTVNKIMDSSRFENVFARVPLFFRLSSAGSPVCRCFYCFADSFSRREEIFLKILSRTRASGPKKANYSGLFFLITTSIKPIKRYFLSKVITLYISLEQPPVLQRCEILSTYNEKRTQEKRQQLFRKTGHGENVFFSLSWSHPSCR